MEKIDYYQARKHLQDSEAVATVSGSNVTYYFFSQDKIHVVGSQYRYKLTMKEFDELFRNETFYLYSADQQTVDELKDEDYYTWKSKGVN